MKPLFFETDEHGNLAIKSEGAAKTTVLEDIGVGERLVMILRQENLMGQQE